VLEAAPLWQAGRTAVRRVLRPIEWSGGRRKCGRLRRRLLSNANNGWTNSGLCGAQHEPLPPLDRTVVAGNWETHFVRTTDPDATAFDTPRVLLARQNASTPPATFSPYIGDYASLISAGRMIGPRTSSTQMPRTGRRSPRQSTPFFRSQVEHLRRVARRVLYLQAASPTLLSDLRSMVEIQVSPMQFAGSHSARRRDHQNESVRCAAAA